MAIGWSVLLSLRLSSTKVRVVWQLVSCYLGVCGRLSRARRYFDTFMSNIGNSGHGDAAPDWKQQASDTGADVSWPLLVQVAACAAPSPRPDSPCSFTAV